MENHSDIEIDFLRFHSVLQYLDEQAESQEPKALEEKPLYKCNGSCLGTHGPECKVAKPQEEPKKIGKYDPETGHLTVCSSQSGDPFDCHICHQKETEPKLPQSDFRMNPEEVVKAGKDWWDLQKETEPKEDAEYKLDISVSYLKLVLPMAKAYAAKNDVGSNQEYIENAEKFIKSQE